MNYKNLNNGDQEKTRILRRLWEVEVYDGDKDDPLCETRTETVVAFNHVEAIRLVPGDIAELPNPICHVTWPRMGDPDGDIYRIDNTSDGPVGDPVKPTIALPEVDPWDF